MNWVTSFATHHAKKWLTVMQTKVCANDSLTWRDSVCTHVPQTTLSETMKRGPGSHCFSVLATLKLGNVFGTGPRKGGYLAEYGLSPSPQTRQRAVGRPANLPSVPDTFCDQFPPARCI